MEIIVKETIEYIDRLEIDITETWGKLVTGQITQAMNAMDGIFEKLGKLINYINLINEKFKKNIDINSIFNVFIQLENIMRIPDYVYMADLIEYEIKPILNTWKEGVMLESMLH